ncbi:MAG TPA: recombinase RecT, partial [Agitococcus sp.]|nr:recombinase RecT [Agitococcus sp.]
MVLNGDSMDKMLKFSQMMATSKITIPKHLQGNTGDCFAIVMQAMQWGMNPFAVAQKTHLVNGVLGYEAQLVNAVINSRAPITTRLNYEWFGDWSNVNGKTSNADDVGVIVSATMQGESEPRTLSVSMAQVGNVRNSPLWVNDPRQQLAYLATKRWSRLYCPDVILGVYTADEFEEASEPKDVT